MIDLDLATQANESRVISTGMSCDFNAQRVHRMIYLGDSEAARGWSVVKMKGKNRESKSPRQACDRESD